MRRVAMKRGVLAITAAGLALLSLGSALARPFTPAMSCAAAAGIVAANGAIVLSTSQTTYDRFVHDRRFCAYGESVEAAFVPTRETPSCLIGYTCRSQEYEPFFRR